MQTTHRNKTHTLDNIEFLVSIGQFKLRLSLPKHTTVQGLLSVVKGYEALHDQYGPQGTHFIGLAAQHCHPVLDYWLSQPQLDFTQYRKRLELKCLYSSERRTSHLTLNELQFLVCLGKGACGSVYLVRSRITGCVLALKRVSKEGITNYNALMTQFRERKNMIRLGSNPHTVTLHATFESREHFNFLLDYYPGGELFLHLTDPQKRLSLSGVKRYFCEILLAMEYIHRKKVLYRDLKPENIFVDLKGHLRIGDFGMSKCDFEEDDFAASICGSPQYMAPEILQNKDYNFSADFYSIGALLYELLTGYPPHYKQQENQKLQQIKNMDLGLDSVTKDPLLRQLLIHLLHPDPEQRISNFQEIKNSAWLGGVDWKIVENKQEIMPLVLDPNQVYIGKEFLDLQREVDEINHHFHDDSFTSDIADAFEYVRPQSRKLLGLDQDCPQSKPLKKMQPSRPEKKHIVKKTNVSIATIEKEESSTEIVSTLEGKTKDKQGQLNKENREHRENVLRRDNSKKNLSKQPSQIILLGKSTITANNAMIRPQKSQRILLTTNSHNSSECSTKNVSNGKDSVRIRISDVREGKSKCRSKQKSIKQSSVPKVNMLKRKEEKKNYLPTCSYRIKLT